MMMTTMRKGQSDEKEENRERKKLNKENRAIKNEKKKRKNIIRIQAREATTVIHGDESSRDH